MSLEANFSGLRVFAMWLVAIFMLAFGPLMAVAAAANGHVFSTTVLVGAFLAFAGWLAAWMAWRMRLPGRPTLRMDAQGLSHSMVGEVRWQDVLGIDLYQHVTRGKPWMLILGTATPAAIRQRGLARWIVPMRRNFLEFSLKGLDREPAEIHAAALALRDRVQPPRMEGWMRGMTQVQLQVLRVQREMTELMEAGLRDGPKPENLPAIEAKSREVLAASEAFRDEAQQTLRRFQQTKWVMLILVALAVVVLVLRFLAIRAH